MDKAKRIGDIPNVFQSRPLAREELDRFYFQKTMPVRTGDLYDDPMDDIFNICTGRANPDDPDRKPVLLVGNRGCGKSTELNSLSDRLRKDGCRVHTVECRHDMDLGDPVYADLLILIADALTQIAGDVDCEPDPAALKILRDFWMEEEETRTVKDESGFKVGAGFSLEPSVKMKGESGFEAGGMSSKLALKVILKFFAELRADYAKSDERRKFYREKVKRRLSEWMSAVNSIAGSIAQTLNGKPPVIIFEDLDKLHSKEVWQVFYTDGVKLTGFHFPVIYTFPSAFALDDRYSDLEQDFELIHFYMIQIIDADNAPYEPGYAAIMEILRRRAELSLFEGGDQKDGVLRLLIEKTGGSLRDLFDVIYICFTRANRRDSPIIQREDAEWAIEKKRKAFAAKVDSAHYDFLKKMYESKEARQQIQDRKLTMDLLDRRVILEHNGWRCVHPLIVDFLTEQGVINRG